MPISASSKKPNYRVYINPVNEEWLRNDLFSKGSGKNSRGRSKVINQSLSHLRASLTKDLQVADRRFNKKEMDALTALFQSEDVPWYYSELNHFYLVLESITQWNTGSCKHLQKAIVILKQHSTLPEINAIVFRSKY